MIGTTTKSSNFTIWSQLEDLWFIVKKYLAPRRAVIKKPKLLLVKRRMFWKTLKEISTVALYDNDEVKRFLKDCFLDKSKASDGRGWLPLHCAVLCRDVEVTDV